MITFSLVAAGIITFLFLCVGLVRRVYRAYTAQVGRARTAQIESRCVRDKELRAIGTSDIARVLILTDGREIEVDGETYHATTVGETFTGKI